jgi:hypothetical protein
LLDKIVETITANRDVWVAVMMAEEHGLTPTNRGHALRSAVVVAAITLFIVGAYKARLTIGSPGKSGLEMALISTVSALVGYAVGALLKLPGRP